MASVQALVVDDDELSRDLLGAMLQRLNIASTLCADGSEALSLLAARSFDLLLLDLRLPDMDGLEVVRRHRAAAAEAVMPRLVLTTGADRVESREKCEQIGCDGFLSKPFTFSDFKNLMESLFPDLDPA